MSPTAGAAEPVGTKWAEVDSDALRANTASLVALTGGRSALMAMVKANGYGHGAVAAATAALRGGATWLGVSSIREAVELRAAGLAAPILNVGWTAPDEMDAAVSHDVDVTVFDIQSVEGLRAAARRASRTARAHWKLDTGMGRLGTPAAEVAAMHAALRAAGEVGVAGLFTHFAAADDLSTDFTLRQHARFMATMERVRESFPDALLHSANSAALLRLPETHHDIVRVGIALYGYAPANCAGIVDLRPALQVRALVTQVKRVRKGDTVGYGREWTAPRESRVATVAAGYADGVSRRNLNVGTVIVGGTICPMVGRISMDQVSVDITEAGDVSSGHVATLIGTADGHSIDADIIAARLGTISNEVLCAVSVRVPRVIVNEEVAP